MKKMNEMKMVKKAMAVMVAALMLGGGTFAAILWLAGTDNAEAKEGKAGIEQIAGEKAVKESEKEEREKKEEKEEKADDPEAENTTKAESENNNANRNNTNTSGSASKPSGNIGSNTPAAPAHTHSWNAVYKTVTVPVERSKWTRLCNACRIENPSLDHLAEHAYNFEVSATHTETIYWTEYVEEQQLSHYQCSCGATK